MKPSILFSCFIFTLVSTGCSTKGEISDIGVSSYVLDLNIASERFFGGLKEDRLYAGVKHNENGYLLVGTSEVPGSRKPEGWLIHLDNNSQFISQQRIKHIDQLNGVIFREAKIPGGDTVLVGWVAQANNPEVDGWLAITHHTDWGSCLGY